MSDYDKGLAAAQTLAIWANQEQTEGRGHMIGEAALGYGIGRLLRDGHTPESIGALAEELAYHIQEASNSMFDLQTSKPSERKDN